ncbi:uncharacterized protein K444DRAFT_669824 [Hyaloscypha bicolor E]|uniref:LysM domain-containing protein n=1 Tax=Hyaloscypha bicolor E TaxID=1095630 RepID=A0A2J6SN79_9HELO|nr:uncharacterized protein K444DRAFT_669824 [Hyaloscypha bicolor E]PMD52203.1 hypothetical protein K444DRAFT_669824 [Hyaloscypha bicolor E]
MKFTGILQVFLLFALLSLGLGASLPAGFSLRIARDGDYTVGKMGFKGEIGGHYFELNGTLQDVVAQAQKLHPGLQHNWTAPDLSKGPLPDGKSLEARQGTPIGRFCWPVAGQPWGAVYHTDLSAAIDALRSVFWNLCTFPPNACAPLSCTANTQLSVCNDNPWSIAVNCGNTLSEMALEINQNCNTWNGLTGGQQFNSMNYNLVVEYRGGC